MDVRAVLTLARFVVPMSGVVVVAMGSLPAGAATTTPVESGLEPRLVWHVPGEGRGTPAVYRDTAYFLSKRHEVVAIDLRTGRVRWKRMTNEPGDSTSGSSVVTTPSGVIAGDYRIVSFDHDGVEQWRFTPTTGYGPGIYLGSVSRGLVFAGSPSGHLYAVDVKSGRARWSLPVAQNVAATVFAPVVSEGDVVAGYSTFGTPSRGGLVVVDALTGAERWRRDLPNSPGVTRGLAGGPIVAGALVLAASRDGVVHAFDKSSGALRMSFGADAQSNVAAPADDYRALAHTGRLLFAGSLSGSVAAYDLESGLERWRTTSVEASVAFGIASDGRSVYVPYLSGHLVALNVEDGSERWRTSGGAGGFHWRPLPVGGRLYANASAAGFFAFRL